jgi:hypothetical protein
MFDVRQIMERTQAINLFWEREIDKFLKLKPSAMITKDEVVSLQEGLGAGRGGASQLDVNDLWKTWTDGYKELVKLASETTKANSRDELLQIYGVTAPLGEKKGE